MFNKLRLRNLGNTKLSVIKDNEEEEEKSDDESIDEEDIKDY